MLLISKFQLMRTWRLIFICKLF